MNIQLESIPNKTVRELAFQGQKPHVTKKALIHHRRKAKHTDELHVYSECICSPGVFSGLNIESINMFSVPPRREEVYGNHKVQDGGDCETHLTLLKIKDTM